MAGATPLFGIGSSVSPLLSPTNNSTTGSKTFLSTDSFSQSINDRYYLQLGAKKTETAEEADEDEEVGEDTDRRNDSKFHINKSLLVYKAFYFLFFGAVGSLFPYLAVFYKQLYLSAQQVGFLIGIRPFIQMCAGPLWGALADTYNVKRFILLLSIAAWLGTNYSISIVRIPPEVACNKNFSIIKMPDIGKLTESKKRPVVVENNKIPYNSSLAFSLVNHTVKSTIEAKKRPIEKLIIRKRDFESDEDNSSNDEEELVFLMYSRSVDKSNLSSNENHQKANSSNRKKRHVKEKIMTFVLSNREPNTVKRMKRNLDNEKTVKKRPQLWGSLNVTHQEELLPIQRMLAADELEEEFDSLNTDDEYPWPIENIAASQQILPREDAKNSLKIFIVLIIITVVGTVVASPAATIADTATLEILGDKTYQYGYQRLWGSFGWGLCAFIVGAIVSGIQDVNCTNGRHVDYILSFYVYAVMMAMAFLCAAFFKFTPIENPSAYTESLWEAIKMFCDCQHACFVATLLCNGAAMGFIHTFLFWHLHDLGGTQLLFSVIAATQCVSEVVMYLAASYLILHIGCDKVLYIGLLSNLIRLTLYSIIRTPLYSVPLEILHGVSSASIWTSSICYIGLIPGTPVTLQALLHGIYWGLGHGGGGIIGGVLVTYIGAHGTFTVYAIVCSINFTIVILLKYWGKIITLLGNYQFVENIPAGTYILTTMSHQDHADEAKNREP